MSRPAAAPPPIPTRAKRPSGPALARRPPGVRAEAVALVDHAYQSLRRLAAARPVAGPASAAAEAIERVHLAGPFTVAIAGETAPRSAFLDYLTGGQLFDPTRRSPPGMVLSVRRGPATLCRAGAGPHPAAVAPADPAAVVGDLGVGAALGAVDALPPGRRRARTARRRAGRDPPPARRRDQR
jgi:hypothetical protein